MKKIILFLFLALGATGFAENLILENQTPYPMKNQKSKMAIQWANSAKQVDEANHAVAHKLPLNSSTLQTLPRAGKLTLTIPQNAEYFRVLVWSKGEGEPDLLTNWVDITANKTYKLKTDHLVPTVLMLGTGC